MRSLWSAISVVLLINALVLVGAAVWLYSSGRLNRQRVDQGIEVFRLTTDEQEKLAEQQQQQQKKEDEQKKEQDWRESVKAGQLTVGDRLGADDEAKELVLQRIERLGEDRRALLRSMQQYRAMIESLQKKLKTQKEQFDRQVAERAERAKAEGFQQAVTMLERIKPKQGKDMFVDLMRDGQSDQAIEYLGAMQPRKAASVLKQFKGDEEIPLALSLVEGLRRRGIDPFKTASPGVLE